MDRRMQRRREVRHGRERRERVKAGAEGKKAERRMRGIWRGGGEC